MRKESAALLLLTVCLSTSIGLAGQESWPRSFEYENPALVYSTFAPDVYAALREPAVAIDPEGNLHVAAYRHTGMVVAGQTSIVAEGVLAKLNAAGSAYIYTLTYLGVRATSVAVDSVGNAYYTGIVEYEAGFKTTPGALNEPQGRGVVLKVSPKGETLYAARIAAQPRAITVDSAGRAYLAGVALADFTATPGSYKSQIGVPRCVATDGVTPSACPDAFAARLTADGSRFEWATFFGGGQDDSAVRIARDPAGAVYIAGETSSSDMPTTAGALQTQYGGGEVAGALHHGDGFLVKFSETGSTLLYATYLGGSHDDFVTGLALADDASVAVAGTTRSLNFPVSATALQRAYGGGSEEPGEAGDLFLVRLDRSGAALESTYLGGSLPEVSGPALALPGGRLAVALNEPQLSGVPCAWWGRLVVLANGKVERVYALPQSTEGGQSIAASSAKTLYAAGYTGIVPPFGLSRNAPNQQGTVLVTQLDLADTSDVVPTCIANGASFHVGSQLGSPTMAIAPGEIVSLFGRDIGPKQGMAAEFDQGHPLPTDLGGTRVLVNGSAIPLLYVSDRQINAITPFELSGDTATVRVESEHGTTHEYTIPLAPALPGIFSTGLGGSGQAAVINQDGPLNSQSNRAPRGSIVSIYATGLGRLSPAPANGSIVPIDPPFPTLVEGLQVYIAAPVETGAAGMEVLYAGAAPGLVAGAVQINARIPLAASAGPSVPIRIVIDSTFERSQEAVSIGVAEPE